MPVWLLALLPKVLDFLWHSIKRFWSVFLIGFVILSVGLWIRGYKVKVYNNGYKEGYAQAIKDHPQSVGTIINDGGFEWLGIDFNIWKLHLKLGF